MLRSARNGLRRARGCFVQYYGSSDLDASLLLLPLVGFLPPDDPRVRGDDRAIERELVVDGLVALSRPCTDVDGLPPGEGAVPAVHVLAGRQSRLAGRQPRPSGCSSGCSALRNDVGLLSEEYDPDARHSSATFRRR